MPFKQNLLQGAWDAIVLLTTLYAAIGIPIELAFETSLATTDVSEWFITAVFLLDFILRAGMIRRKDSTDGFLELEEKLWFQRSLLLTDLMAAIPFALFLPYPALHLFRLFKLFRVTYIFRSYQHRFLKNAGIFAFISFTFWLVIATNGIACGWHGAGDFDELSDITTPYINALYWTITTLTTVGYGDITPVTNVQKLYTMFVQVLGFGVFTFAIGTVASRLMQKDPATVRYRENIEGLAALMHYKSLPEDLRERVVHFYKYIWKKRLGYDETSFLESLPHSLQIEVALHLKREVIEKVSLFSHSSQAFRQEIALLLKPVFLMPGDYMFKAGDLGEAMYFVVNGELETLTRSEDKVLTILKPGDFFGEIALFKNQYRSATIRARTYCDIYALDKSAFDNVICKYPDIEGQIRTTVEERERKYSV